MTAKLVPERAGLNPTHTRDVYYGWDARGLQTYARFDSPGGEGVINAWDQFGRLAATTLIMDGVGRTIQHHYDAGGRRTRVTHPDSGAFSYSYDSGGALTGLYSGPDTSVPLALFAYDAFGCPRAATSAAAPVGRLTWPAWRRRHKGRCRREERRRALPPALRPARAPAEHKEFRRRGLQTSTTGGRQRSSRRRTG
jgi:YD repeat-containing protein